MLTPKWNSKSVGEYERSLKPKVEDDDDIQDYKKPWVGLTKKEVHELWESTDSDDDCELMKRTEAKLKEKNNERD